MSYRFLLIVVALSSPGSATTYCQGQSKCSGHTTCPVGMTSRFEGSTTCESCVAGQYCPFNETSPSFCPEGTASNATNQSTKATCAACNNGRYAPFLGMTFVHYVSKQCLVPARCPGELPCGASLPRRDLQYRSRKFVTYVLPELPRRLLQPRDRAGCGEGRIQLFDRHISSSYWAMAYEYVDCVQRQSCRVRNGIEVCRDRGRRGSLEP